MFKSVDNQTGQEIIILDPAWNDSTIEILRTKSQDNQLACPTCKQPVHVRAGKKKRWHFAHKDLSDCPLKHESPNILQARSLLYKWLKLKFDDKVTIEKNFPESELPRPLDCYVEVSENQKFGYWILEKGIRSRYPLEQSFSQLNINVTWVFLSSMLKIDAEKLTSVHLSPTERDFAYSSDYNQIYSQCDESINYLNIDDGTVTTLRGLRCVHLPQQYKFSIQLKDNLENLLVSPKTGEIVYKNEHEKLREHQEALESELQRIEEERILELQRREEQRKQPRRSENILLQQQIDAGYEHKSSEYVPSSDISKENAQSSLNDGSNELYQCVVCETMTASWTTLDLATNTCVCSRECLRVQLSRLLRKA